jgi:hypothetical protein
MTLQSTSLRHYWVVSPNVKNNEATVGDWRQASIRERAAFMGWGPNDYDHAQIGPTFAGKTKHSVSPGDVILIARRHQYEPEIVGFGVVKGAAKTMTRSKAPEAFGSLRKLSPFKPWSRAPGNIPIIDILRHTRAIIQLHPKRNTSHRKVCMWMERKLALHGKTEHRGKELPVSGKIMGRRKSVSTALSIVDRPESHQLDYKVQTKSKVITAKQIEARLVAAYAEWLTQQDRRLVAAKYARLQCDGYEPARRNLIEAKSATTREHIRMAAGQLLDYAFEGQAKFGVPSKAILLPEKPASDLIRWLVPLNIHVIWREGSGFYDNANGQFI